MKKISKIMKEENKKPKKKDRPKRMKIIGKKYESMPITKYRESWIKKGYDLVDVTQLCEFKLGISGWCSDFNEPDEQCYHIQVWYRDENIGVFYPSTEQNNWEDKYVVFIDDEDFIIFRKIKLEKENGL